MRSRRNTVKDLDQLEVTLCRIPSFSLTWHRHCHSEAAGLDSSMERHERGAPRAWSATSVERHEPAVIYTPPHYEVWFLF